ncbi:hypothetical protein EON65_09110 [archaeon]|nr:MAG: hypothetical protein EON65_09110 [archaeon]
MNDLSIVSDDKDSLHLYTFIDHSSDPSTHKHPEEEDRAPLLTIALRTRNEHTILLSGHRLR